MLGLVMPIFTSEGWSAAHVAKSDLSFESGEDLGAGRNVTSIVQQASADAELRRSRREGKQSVRSDNYYSMSV